MEEIFDLLTEEGRLSFRAGIFPYKVYGKGSPVLFFPPLRGGGEALLRTLCAAGHRVIVPGVPEQPKSDPTAVPPDYDCIADRTAYLLWRMGVECLPVVGTAAGACMALTFAELYGRVPSGLALLDPVLYSRGLQVKARIGYAHSTAEKKKGQPYYSLSSDVIHINKSALSALACPLLLSFSSPGPVRRRHQALVKSALPTREVTLCEGEVFADRLVEFLK